MIDSDNSSNENQDASLVIIAQFAHAAEAGFFADELATNGNMETVVELEDHFDAISGTSVIKYQLKVAEENSKQAAELLHKLIEQNPLEEYDEYLDSENANFTDDDNETKTQEENHESSLMPVVLVLSVGLLLFWTFKNQLENVFNPAEPASDASLVGEDFWREAETTSEPWVQQTESGSGSRQLWIHSDKRQIILREDKDGDGQFENSSRFDLNE